MPPYKPSVNFALSSNASGDFSDNEQIGNASNKNLKLDNKKKLRKGPNIVSFSNNQNSIQNTNQNANQNAHQNNEKFLNANHDIPLFSKLKMSSKQFTKATGLPSFMAPTYRTIQNNLEGPITSKGDYKNKTGASSSNH
jgi:superfamily II DNA helicase RecQ